MHKLAAPHVALQRYLAQLAVIRPLDAKAANLSLVVAYIEKNVTTKNSSAMIRVSL